MATIFSRIATKELPAHIIDETDDFLAFLDINPLMTGHTLVIPKKEVDYIFDLDNQTLAGLHVFSKKIAQAIQKAVPCERIGVAIMGLEVPHAHIHLIPINEMNDMNFGQMKLSPTEEQLAATAKKIIMEL